MKSILAVTCLTVCVLESVSAQEPVEPNRQRIAPAPAIFKLKIQSAALFPDAEKGTISTAAEDRGLSLTIQPERRQFARNGPLAFEVVFQNNSDERIMLPGLSTLGHKPQLVIGNQKTAAQWTITGESAAGDQVTIAPGKSQKYSLVVQGNWRPMPRPLPPPIPQPMPRPVPRPKVLPQQEGDQIAPPNRRRPAPVIVAPSAALPVGSGPCRARLLLKFVRPKDANEQTTFWTGRISSGVADFTISEQFEAPPANNENGVNGLNENAGNAPIGNARIINLAHAAAERALKRAYEPVDGVKPPHEGDWITDPEKTAQIKMNPKGGWTVSWSQFPRETGFRYSVVVDVTAAVRATVREVFATYVKR